ncbi:MAG: hypothetical protein LCH95_08875 [Proteobacteria bacterium]|nr:hypothetical protein [Pseudomonadota bacterium]
MMGKATALGLAIALVAGTAQAQVIDLKGTWTGIAEAIFEGPAAHHGKPGASGAGSRFKLNQQPFTFVFEGQEGRRFWGMVSSPTSTERIIGSLSVDGKSVHMVDDDGMVDGTVVNADTLDLCYRHVGKESALVSCLRVTRKK